MKLPLGDLNLGSCPPHPTSTYIYGVTVAPRVCSDILDFSKKINFQVFNLHVYFMISQTYFIFINFLFCYIL